MIIGQSSKNSMTSRRSPLLNLTSITVGYLLNLFLLSSLAGCGNGPHGLK
jgi:hypothetical protein